MTEKTHIVEYGAPIIGSSLSSTLETRHGYLQLSSNYANPFVISGLDVTAADLGGGSWSITVTPGIAMIQGKIFQITAADVFTITPTEDTVITVYYKAGDDVPPNYDCLSIVTVDSSTWDFPAHSPSGDAYCPLAIFDYSEDNVVNEIKPRVPVYYITQDAGFIGYDESSPKNGVWDIINESPTEAGLVNYALRVKNFNTNGYGLIVDGKTRLMNDVVITDGSVIYDNLTNDLITFSGGMVGIGKVPTVALDVNGDFSCSAFSAASAAISGAFTVGGTLSIGTLVVSDTVTITGYINGDTNLVGKLTCSNGIACPSTTSYFTDGSVDLSNSAINMNDAVITCSVDDLTINGTIAGALTIETSGSMVLSGTSSVISFTGNTGFISMTGTTNNITLSGANSYISVLGASAEVRATVFKQPSYKKVITISPGDFTWTGKTVDPTFWDYEDLPYGNSKVTYVVLHDPLGVDNFIRGDEIHYHIPELIHGCDITECHLTVYCTGTDDGIDVVVSISRPGSTLYTSGSQHIAPAGNYTFNITGQSIAVDKSIANHYAYTITVDIDCSGTDTNDGVATISDVWVVTETDYPLLSA